MSWNFLWRRRTFLWENNLIVECLAKLEGITLGEEVDRWWWLPEDSGIFSINSSYRVLVDMVLLEDGLSEEVEESFAKLWKSPAPSKVVTFSWLEIIDRIPTRSNLAWRHVLAPGESRECVFCAHGEETSTHLFVHCEVAVLIWRKLMDWLEVSFITPQHLLIHFDCWNAACNSRRLLKAFKLIWHAVIWSIWKEMNARIFNNQIKHFEVVVDEIKALSWYWAMSRLQMPSCLFYEWTWNPKECIIRR